MSETLTFANFQVGIDDVRQVGAMPETADSPERPGVLKDLAVAFGYEGDDMGGLVGAIAPHRELQNNIDHAKERLADPEVQKRLGYEDLSSAEIARDICQRAGLMQGVDKIFMPGQGDFADGFDVGIVPERVINWMNREADSAIETARERRVGLAALASSVRAIGPDEKPEVAGGTPAQAYMETDIKPRLEASGLFGAVEILRTGEDRGDDVMVKAAQALVENGMDPAAAKIVVFAVAGNWIQSALQARNGLQAVYPEFDGDPANRQLWVVSKTFPLGETGDEPKETHQNPFSALGNIVRNGLFLDKVAKQDA
jgi:hypothetical protein